jgi:DNA repair exonuclease SbcCD ATPase subunit
MKTAEPLMLEYEASDDFGLTEAKLHYELQRAFTSEPETGSIGLPNPSVNEEQSYQWNVPGLNPKARDQITYWIEVYDNDQYSGRKKGSSQKMTITFPSTTEYMEELDSKERDVTKSLEDVSQSFEQMEKQYEQFKQQLQQKPETDWEQKQQLEKVEEERQEINKKVDDLNKKFEDIRKEIEENQAMSPETLEAYNELQNLMKEINDPELEKALEELRNSLGDMDPDEMRKALENYEFNEEQYRQRIDRTLNLFKSLKLNSDLEKMAQSLEKLSEQEKEISESKEVSPEEIDQQQSIMDDLSNLQEQLQKIDDTAPDKAKSQVEKLQLDNNEQLKNIQKELQENINNLKEQSSPKKDTDIQKQQQNIQKQLQKQAQNMRNAKQQLNQQRRQVNRAALEYVLHSLINLSENQEELTKETENIPPRSGAFVEKARKERNISSQFTMLSDSLFEVSSELPSFSNRINKKKTEVENQLSRAVDLLAERDGSNATYAQRESMGGINDLTTMITSLLDQLNNQQGGGSGGTMSMQQLMEQMKKMSGEQQQLNQQIQEMINDMQGNRLSQDQMERLNQLSKQQNRIRKQMRKLQRRGQLESGDRVLSELERMSEQMEDAINDLRGGQLDEQLKQRQQNILSRMLNAEKAIQERGKEEQREATTAQEPNQGPSPDVTLEELQKQVRQMINNPNYTSFSDDYQRLIEQYFELLKELEN